MAAAVLRTRCSGCSSWPTPTTTCSRSRCSSAAVVLLARRPAVGDRCGRGRGPGQAALPGFGAVVFGRLGARRAILYAAAACRPLPRVLGRSSAAGRYFHALLATVAAAVRPAMDPLRRRQRRASPCPRSASRCCGAAARPFPVFGGWLYPALAPVLFPGTSFGPCRTPLQRGRARWPRSWHCPCWPPSPIRSMASTRSRSACRWRPARHSFWRYEPLRGSFPPRADENGRSARTESYAYPDRRGSRAQLLRNTPPYVSTSDRNGNVGRRDLAVCLPALHAQPRPADARPHRRVAQRRTRRPRRGRSRGADRLALSKRGRRRNARFLSDERREADQVDPSRHRHALRYRGSPLLEALRGFARPDHGGAVRETGTECSNDEHRSPSGAAPAARFPRSRQPTLDATSDSSAIPSAISSRPRSSRTSRRGSTKAVFRAN